MDNISKDTNNEPLVGAYVSKSDNDISFTLPTVDISGETDRHVFIAEGTEEIYQGHPTTLLLPDGNTLLCTWTSGHGGGCGFLKRSEDGGRSWSELQDLPKNWSETSNCPTLFRLPDPDGNYRLFVYAGSGPDGCMQLAFSGDEGASWSEMQSTGLHCVMPFCAITPVEGGRRLLGLTNVRRITSQEGVEADEWSNIIVKSYSEDGGFTWSAWEVVADDPRYRFCEPYLVFSPDPAEKRWVCLIRENRYGESFRMTSEDEGQTWTKPEAVPVGLHGDRHIARYVSDGRLVVAFRDRAGGSGTSGHFVVWVGHFPNVLGVGEGEYRIKLLHNYAGFDCGYPGLEVLKDDTLLATTYLKYWDGEKKHSVVSTRFNLSEIDARLMEVSKS